MYPDKECCFSLKGNEYQTKIWRKLKSILEGKTSQLEKASHCMHDSRQNHVDSKKISDSQGLGRDEQAKHK